MSSSKPSSRAGSPRKDHSRKPSAFSWEIEGKDYTRRIQFKAMKEDEKIGFGLGGKDKKQEVVCIREQTQAYWKGILVGYTVTQVNDKEVNKITVTPAIRDATLSGKDFTITFLVPNKPDWADKENEDIGAEPADPKGKKDDAPAAAVKAEKPIIEDKEEPPKEEAKVEEIPIIDNENYEDDPAINDEDDGMFPKSQTMHAATVTQAKPPVAEPAKVIDLNTASKEELQELERMKQQEIRNLERSQATLQDQIRQKETELKQSHERAVLEELKRLRKLARELKDAYKRALEELERIREMLRRRLRELELGMSGLQSAQAARDAKLSALEAQVRALQNRA